MTATPSTGEGAGQPVHVLHVKVGQPATVLFLDQPKGVIEHYASSHGFPHRRENRCPRASCLRGSFFYSYAPVLVYHEQLDQWLGWVLRLTQNLHYSLACYKLRGSVWRVERETGKGVKGELKGDPIEDLSGEDLPPPFKVRDVLVKLWGHDDWDFDVPNPTPKPVVVEPVKLRAPPKGVIPLQAPQVEEPARPGQIEELKATLSQFGNPAEAKPPTLKERMEQSRLKREAAERQRRQQGRAN